MFLVRLGLSAVLSLALLTPAQSVTLPDIAGPVLLTVTGLDRASHPGGQIELDVGRLEALGTTEVETSSIWTEGVHLYRGVALRTLADHLGMTTQTFRLHALNDYAVEFPIAEMTAEVPVLAFEMDGAPMSVREKGPVWLIYPYDLDADYRTDTVYSRSIWQLDRIDVLR